MSQGAGKDRSLPLAAAERKDFPLSQMIAPGEVHRPFHRLPVCGLEGTETVQVRITPHRYHLFHGEIEPGAAPLPHHAHSAGQIATLPMRQRLSVDNDLAGIRREHRRHIFQQGGFSAAVGADNTDKIALRQREADPVEHCF